MQLFNLMFIHHWNLFYIYLKDMETEKLQSKFRVTIVLFTSYSGIIDLVYYLNIFFYLRNITCMFIKKMN